MEPVFFFLMGNYMDFVIIKADMWPIPIGCSGMA